MNNFEEFCAEQLAKHLASEFRDGLNVGAALDRVASPVVEDKCPAAGPCDESPVEGRYGEIVDMSENPYYFAGATIQSLGPREPIGGVYETHDETMEVEGSMKVEGPFKVYGQGSVAFGSPGGGAFGTPLPVADPSSPPGTRPTSKSQPRVLRTRKKRIYSHKYPIEQDRMAKRRLNYSGCEDYAVATASLTESEMHIIRPEFSLPGMRSVMFDKPAANGMVRMRVTIPELDELRELRTQRGGRVPTDYLNRINSTSREDKIAASNRYEAVLEGRREAGRAKLAEWREMGIYC
ncbi:hypothetical protein BJ875DRAFT_440995 [Amylocarpus encephaloides]|uniref:Uncharacterized protein n=1 Tax=Amylocarpus encephaloides TaxID=45428 RepID=A0A9P8C5M6_9HELO|nr:hypothetical protein BJ875DRAFT_440995 [Amylocarpus encephaloides]